MARVYGAATCSDAINYRITNTSRHTGAAEPQCARLGFRRELKAFTKKGGVSAALETLHGFLQGRGLGYSQGISSPLLSASSGSRLSPYLAYGNLSLRSG